VECDNPVIASRITSLQTDLSGAPPSGRTGRLVNAKENDDAILVRAQAIMSVEQPGEVSATRPPVVGRRL
jgi:hypothetical protein